MRPRHGYDSRLLWLPVKTDAAAVELAERPLNDRKRKSHGELKRHWYGKKKKGGDKNDFVGRRGAESPPMSHGSHDSGASFPRSRLFNCDE